MRDPLPFLAESTFPPLRRGSLSTLQINVGYRCNQSCLHCHVSAGPNRVETMSRETAEAVVAFMRASSVDTLDITGGAPELNEQFRYLVHSAADAGVGVIDRCNLTILHEPGQEDLAAFLAGHRVRIVASLPCYTADNVDAQRGKGVYEGSIEGLRKLNAAGYGDGSSGLVLDLVYNPLGPVLPPPQAALEADYKRELGERFGVTFDNLLTLANMPVGRFGSTLISRGEFGDYMTLLKDAHRDENLDGVMCRSLISVDYEGYLFDCDFNQMLNLPARFSGPQNKGSSRTHIRELTPDRLDGAPIVVRDHCYGCTAGQGSSCGGALA